MFAAFLKNADGSFAIIRFAISLVGAWLAMGTPLWFLPKAVRAGRIPFFAGWGISRTAYIERKKNPIYFWFVFALYCLLIPAGIHIIILACVGPEQKPN